MQVSPFVAGPTVGIRSLEASDVPLLHRWINNPVVNVFSTMAVLPKSSDSVERMVAELLKSENSKGLIAEHPDHGPIGFGQLRHINWKDRNAELSVLIGDPVLWGRGVGTECLCLLCALAFEAVGLHRVYAYVIEFNDRSSRLVRKLGFEQEGTLREAYFAGTRFYHASVYGLLRHEYPNGVVRDILGSSTLPWRSGDVARRVSG